MVQGWLLELLARHPELRPPGASSSGTYGGPEWTEQGIGGSGGGGDQGAVPECRPPPRRLHLNVSITGHSLVSVLGSFFRGMRSSVVPLPPHWINSSQQGSFHQLKAVAGCWVRSKRKLPPKLEPDSRPPFAVFAFSNVRSQGA